MSIETDRLIKAFEDAVADNHRFTLESGEAVNKTRAALAAAIAEIEWVRDAHFDEVDALTVERDGLQLKLASVPMITQNPVEVPGEQPLWKFENCTFDNSPQSVGITSTGVVPKKDSTP